MGGERFVNFNITQIKKSLSMMSMRELLKIQKNMKESQEKS